MEISENYRGREQAYVKHKLLRAYLERLFMIIGQSQSRIRYVDCFSGPWHEADKNLQDTSIGISLDIMKKCREGLSKMQRDVTFKALFIEKDKNAYEKLNAHLTEYASPGIETDAQNGEFFNLRESILQWCGSNDFTFFFIDPTGWKHVIEIPTLEPFLRRPNSEFLINFMYDFLLRTHTQESFQDDILSIFGYTPDTNGMEPKQKEEYLIKLYRDNLKHIAPSRGGIPRTAHVPILYPLRDRTMYHLVYLTRHAKGITVFMDESEKLEFVQRRVRSQAKQVNRESRTGQLEIFHAYDHVQPKESVELEKVKAYWLSMLSLQPREFGIKQLADILEERGCFESDLQMALGELIAEGKVANLNDETKRRRKKYIHFNANHNQGEYLIKVKS